MSDVVRGRKQAPEDHLLIEEQFQRLNETFYTSEPADYFERRLQLLAVQSGNWPGLHELLREGVTIGAVKMSDDSTTDPSAEDMLRVNQHFTTTEAELLFHQVGETLLRLYLAHAFSGRRYPACPRLDLAALRSGEEFRARLEVRFVKQQPDNRENRRAVAKVFHFTDALESFGPPAPAQERWDRSLELHESYLRFFAAAFLDGSPLYNAAKHGLALTPAEQAGMAYAGIVKRQGPAINYLTVKRTQSTPIPRWYEVTHWVESDRRMVHIYRACSMIRSLWGVARFRYVTARSISGKNGERTGADVNLSLMHGPTPMEIELKDRDDSPMIVNDMSVSLQYWKPDVPDEPETLA